MILRRIRLENIRSYLSEEVEFPEGSLLLSGDIGSGKSTILLAIDFALFGIQKDLSGASLLKHSKDSGSVELDFEISGKPYTIKRTLKRGSDSVRQAAGHIISDGVKKDLTAQEAKYYILELLGYPVQALKKDSALLYRYTVYTPQEQMKEIIDEDPKSRLDLIRRLFGIDKYKRISENADAYAKELRGRVRELSGSIADLSEKQGELARLKGDAKGADAELKGLRGKLDSESALAKKKKHELDELQGKIEEIQKKKQEYASLKTEFDLLKGDSDALKKAVSESEEKLKQIDAKIAELKGAKKPELATAEIDAKISVIERNMRELLSKSAALETEAKSLSSILDKGVCGTCKQAVSDKGSFKKGIETKLAEIAAIKAEEKKCHFEIDLLKAMLNEVRKYEMSLRERASVEERRKDLSELIARQKNDQEAKQSKYKALAEKINVIVREVRGDTLSQQFKEKQAEFEGMRKTLEALQRQESALLQRAKDLKERSEALESEVKKKEASKKAMDTCLQYDRFLRDFFIKLMGTIEKHVMVNVQHEFNSLFQKWFSMLVMDEGISARVDDVFSVVIEQDGFETDYSFLSGGERTAVALAYRLALNRVINDLTEKIKTKDLLILDEPTDGFSTEQMNSVRDVLMELNTKQTIIVSHEPKVESFVDKTIRFAKENGVSRAIA